MNSEVEVEETETERIIKLIAGNSFIKLHFGFQFDSIAEECFGAMNSAIGMQTN